MSVKDILTNRGLIGYATLQNLSVTDIQLLPRKTTAERDLLNAPEGSILYNTDVNGVEVFSEGSWGPPVSSANHNDLGGLQGGSANEYYHLNQSDYNNVTSTTPSFEAIKNPLNGVSIDIPSTSSIINTNIEVQNVTASQSILEIPSMTWDQIEDEIVIQGSTVQVRNGNLVTDSAFYVDVSPSVFDASILTNGLYFIHVFWNGGSPEYQLNSNDMESSRQHVLVATLYKTSSTEYNFNPFVSNPIAELNDRLGDKERTIQLIEWSSGSSPLNVPSTFEFMIEEGVFYSYVNKIEVPLFDSVGDGFQYFYFDGVDYVTEASVTVLDNTRYYNPVTDQPDPLPLGNYNVSWIYRTVDVNNNFKVYATLAEGSFLTIESARAAPIPGDVPGYILYDGVLVARAICKASSSQPDELISVFQSHYTYSNPTNHENLAGLLGGGPDHYHLTQSEYNQVTVLNQNVGSNDDVSFNSLQTDTIIEKTLDAGVTIDGVLIKDGSIDAPHNNLSSIQGGTTGEYYHLTQAEHTQLTVTNQNVATTDDVTFNSISTDTINEKTLNAGVTIDGVVIKDNGILLLPDETISTTTGTGDINIVTTGDVVLGDSAIVQGDLTVSGILDVDVIEERVLDSGVTIDGVLIKDGSVIAPHNDLSSIQGGNLTERYHLTQAEHTQLTVTNQNVGVGDNVSFGDVLTDNINEVTLDAGVTIDGVQIKDNNVVFSAGNGIMTTAGDLLLDPNGIVNVDGNMTVQGILDVDAIEEKTLDAGVTIDGALIKDGSIDAPHNNLSSIQGGTTGEYYHLEAVEHATRLNEKSTGLVSGGILSAVSLGVSPLFNISAGNAQFFISNVLTNVNFGPFTNETVPDIATRNFTYIGLNSSGSLIKQGVPFTSLENRSIVYLGFVTHPNGVSITDVAVEPNFLGQPSNQIHDISLIIGKANFSGNVFSAATATTIQKSSGKMFCEGCNYGNDLNDPNFVTLSAQNPTTFTRITQDGSYLTTGNTVIDFDMYDNAGSYITIPGSGNQATVKRIFLFVGGQVAIQPGQTIYSTMDDAKASIATETFNVQTDVQEGLLRGYLIVRKGGTDLTNSGDAEFIEAGKFGTGVSSGGVAGTATLQTAYENSINPEIVTDSTRGALSVQRGSAADTDNVIESLNGAGTVTCGITGAGVVKTDVINENTLNAGVTVEGVLIKDNNINFGSAGAGAIQTTGDLTLRADTGIVNIDDACTIQGILDVDTIEEKTLNAGVTIDGVLLKDNDVTCTDLVATTVECDELSGNATKVDFPFGFQVTGGRVASGLPITYTEAAITGTISVDPVIVFRKTVATSRSCTLADGSLNGEDCCLIFNDFAASGEVVVNLTNREGYRILYNASTPNDDACATLKWIDNGFTSGWVVVSLHRATFVP